MKKLSIGMLAVAVTLLVGGSSVYAADSSPISQEVCITYRNACISECFADKNGDGVCDLRFSRQIANEQIPNNLMNVSTSKGNGNFVDEDGDGVCDNRSNEGNGRNGAGQNQAQKTSSGLGYRRACHQR